MEILNFESNGSNRSPKKRARLVTIIGGAFLFAAVGSTFAANITINSGSSIEYAQGLTQATACSDSIKITPTNHYVNSAGSGGSFYVDTITVTDTRTASSSTGLGNCVGKSIKLSAYNSVAGSAALFSCTFSNIAYSSPNVSATVANCPAGAVITSFTSGSDVGLQLAFSNPVSAPNVLAGNVFKFTLESF